MSVPDHIKVRIQQRNKVKNVQNTTDNSAITGRNASNLKADKLEMDNSSALSRKKEGFEVRKISGTQFINDLTYLQKDEFEFARSNVHFFVGEHDPISMHSFLLLTRSEWFRRCWRARHCDVPDYNFRRVKTNPTDIEIECIQPIPDTVNGQFKFTFEEKQHDKYELKLLHTSLTDFKNYLYTGKCEINRRNVRYLVTLSHAFQTENLTGLLTEYLARTISERDINGLLYRLELAYIYDLSELKRACVNMVNTNSFQIVSSSEWEEFVKNYPSLVFEIFRENE